MLEQGKSLLKNSDSPLNLGITENVRQASAELDLDLEQLVRLEKQPGLGNRGLWRLSALYLSC
jgi:starch phosphorylase